MAFAPDLRTFASGRNFAAWLGLVLWQRSTGAKTPLGGVSKMGQTDIRKLLIVGAMSRIRWVIRKALCRTIGLGKSSDASLGWSRRSLWRTRWPGSCG
ncbi:transposase [Pseudaminobacter salicylatoxidans]|uniref:transposase n=1 Tax=Pseudaminobacter salicylatoxidans TaxID=93369 RepID=UPI001FD4368C|nr:transposase [Pseudaminobacter salicylatoxidans]